VHAQEKVGICSKGDRERRGKRVGWEWAEGRRWRMERCERDRRTRVNFFTYGCVCIICIYVWLCMYNMHDIYIYIHICIYMSIYTGVG